MEDIVIVQDNVISSIVIEGLSLLKINNVHQIRTQSKLNVS